MTMSLSSKQTPRPTSAGPMLPIDILVLVLAGVPVEDLKPEREGC